MLENYFLFAQSLLKRAIGSNNKSDVYSFEPNAKSPASPKPGTMYD